MAPGLDAFDVLLEIVLSLVRVLLWLIFRLDIHVENYLL